MLITINAVEHRLTFDVRSSLLDLLREHAGLTGAKKGCNQGGCGACTVLLDGERVLSCLTLALKCEGRRVVTVEGLAGADGLHPLQQAFIDNDGFQCGYCTPGQLCSAIGMADEVRRGVPSRLRLEQGTEPLMTAGEIRERMSGNLCRCGAYNGIVAAIVQVCAGEGA